jgi:hypothetical protein
MALGPTQPPIHWVPGAFSLGVKRPGREADHSPPSSTEVKIAWSYTSTPQYVFMAWCLVKYRDNFTFTFQEASSVLTSYPVRYFEPNTEVKWTEDGVQIIRHETKQHFIWKGSPSGILRVVSIKSVTHWWQTIGKSTGSHKARNDQSTR